MALQLIYTSAPRLLQAGRTGFGTVAAHPGIPSWLVGEIERASQFSRVPGLDPARVVIRHMIFGQGDRVHHVLSRIQDAGADYTGRTNHIAHHFVFTAAEAAKATTLGVTPVDALAYLESDNRWQASWSGEPLSLGDDSILPVESIPKTITLPAVAFWGTLVPGRPECAAILAPGKTSEACWIIYPQGWRDAIVYAMGESLALHSNPWGVSFANDLQPTDNEQQIAWRGIPDDSPLLPKAQSSVRPCIDLSNPNDLRLQPLPEYAEEARTGKKPLPKSLSPASSATKTRPDSKNLNAPPINRPAPATIPLLSKTNNQPRRNPSAKPLVVILGILLLLLGVGGGGYHFYNSYAESTKKISGLKSEITAKIETLDTQKKGLLYENIDKAKNDLEKIDNPHHLNTLSDFLTEISNENVSKAKNILDVMQSDHNYSSDWNNWRTVCDTLLRDKEKEIETETLHDLYAKACLGDALSKEDWNQFQTLVNKHYANDEKWRNALAAVNFLKEPSLDDVSHWMQKREMPESMNGLNLKDKVFEKIHQIQINEYNTIAQISEEEQFRKSLKKHLTDWQKLQQKEFAGYNSLVELLANLDSQNGNPHSVIKNFNSLGLKVPKFMESKTPEDFESGNALGGENPNEGKLPPIYLIAGNSQKLEFAPAISSSSLQQPDKWHSANSSINWNSFSSILVNSWEPNSASQFKSRYNEHPAYYVTDQNSSPNTIKFFVIEKNKITPNIPNYLEICEIESSSIKFKKDFSKFLNRIYQSENHKFKITVSLKYDTEFFQHNDINKKELNLEDKITLGNLSALIKKKEKELKDIIDKNKNDIEEKSKKLSNLEAEFNKQFPFIQNHSPNWKNFVDAVKKKIEEAKKNKLDVEQFKEVFLYNGAKKIDDFLNRYSDITQKEQFISSLSNLSKIDPEVKKWFFFDDKEWSKESQDKFLKQFNKKEFDGIKIEIQNIDSERRQLEDANEKLERELANLEKLKTDQKATLNFYLEEADTEPFLTTEVTIPFRP